MFLKYIVFFIVVFLWLLIIKTFNDLKMLAFKFYTEAIGLFGITIAFFKNYIGHVIIFYTNNLINLINKYIHVFSNNLVNLSLDNKNHMILNILNQDIEIISIIAFSSLIIFFPYANLLKRIFYFIIGNSIILLINVLNIFFVGLLIKLIGGSTHEMICLIISKVIFFIMVMILYYYTFTKIQLKYQKVGEII